MTLQCLRKMSQVSFNQRIRSRHLSIYLYHTGKKIANYGNQKLTPVVYENFSFDFGLVLANYVVFFFANLRRLWLLTDGNQLRGCRLLDIYIKYR